MAGSLLIGRIPVRYQDLQLISELIGAQGEMTFRELAALLTPHWTSYLASSATLLRETLGFAVTLGLLESSSERAWDDRVFTLRPGEASLRAQVLTLLTRQDEPAQRALRGIHDTLVDLGEVHLSVHGVVEVMERSAYAQAFRWNDTKILFWSQLAHDLGLICRMPPERLVLSPSSALLLDLLPSTDGFLRPLLEDWHHRYFAVFTRLGEVHEGTARALLRLEAQGQVTLSYASDAVGTVMLCGRRISHLSRPTTPEVNDVATV